LEGQAPFVPATAGYTEIAYESIKLFKKPPLENTRSFLECLRCARAAQQTNPDYTNVLYGIAATVVVVIVIGAVNLLAYLRKKA